MEKLKQGIQEVEVAADAFKLAKAKVRRLPGCRPSPSVVLATADDGGKRGAFEPVGSTGCVCLGRRTHRIAALFTYCYMTPLFRPHLPSCRAST
jgi:hypothetical protein